MNVAVAKKERSPAYPFISLKVAIERVTAVDEQFKRHPAPADKIGLAWGMKEGSSQGQQTLAALKYFGLVSYEGSGGDRVIKLTDDARGYLRSQQDSVKRELLKKFALMPKAFEKYWADWRADRPIDAVCLDRLVLKDGFTSSAASTFLRVYDETVAFARLGDTDGVGAARAEEVADAEPRRNRAAPSVGDLIQWESGGQLQFTDPQRVRAISEDGTWVFVDGSETGIPTDEVSVEKPASSATDRAIPPTMPEVPRGNATLPNEREWLRGPLSKDASYRLLVTGELDAKQIKRLIRLLEAQVEVLSDDDED